MAAYVANLSLHSLGAVGARVDGIDLSQPLGEPARASLREALDRHGVLVFPDQRLDPEQQLAVAEIFGEVSQQGDNAARAGRYGHISNDYKVGFAGEGELRFHADHCFFPKPLRALMLYAVELPPAGGDTLFADARAAYANLPAGLKERIATLRARHAYDYPSARGHFRAGVEELPRTATVAEHPVVFVHPRSKQPLLYVNRELTYEIVGFSAEESAALLDELIGYVNDDSVIYRHVWKLRDLVVWDNIAMQHARTPFDQQHKRTLRRVQIA